MSRNLEKQKKYFKKYDQSHKEQRKTNKMNFLLNHPNYQKIRYQNNPEVREGNLAYQRSQKGKQINKLWHKNNPRSHSSSYSLELELVMNNVRKRDKNTCKWQNCGLTFREAPIHVHHIFPRSEYPELELIEQYMICYCANHHGLWHRFRGDPYSELISQRNSIGVKN